MSAQYSGVVPHVECVANDANQNVAAYAVTVGDVQVVDTVLGWRLLFERIMKHWLETDRTGEVKP